MLPYIFRDPIIAAFLVLPALMILLFAWGVAASFSQRAVAIALASGAAWMLMTAALADSGLLREWDRTPPPFLILVGAIVVITIVLALSSVGTRLAADVPLWILIAVQAFRLPLELAMHGLISLNIMPAQMSYSGSNFDIVSGATAIVVAAIVAAGRGTRALVLTWNLLGLALLTNIVVIAIASTPRFAYFGPDRLNVFVTYVPFVWLPAVLVPSALFGHLLIFRASRHLNRTPAAAGSRSASHFA